ncbi:MAG TPA: OmpH family outer membrane protein [Candidatus Paceibacterota bacterium]|nr:OmpH family outer membrane protein [Verrucomicrobiota bacterium]HRY49886.1 OmpH family outer membrane protein [Candidatus Paceibacterota bacterium]HSA00143.1 OmpH family outer membrane protein [Candidatus Paceibacterota bacterium]
MKTVAVKWLVIGMTCCLGILSAQAQTKVGIINLKKAFDGYWKTKNADVLLKERAGEFEKQHKEIVENYQKANEEYKKLLDSANDQAVSTEERDRRKKTAEGKLRDIQGIEQQLRQFDTTARSTLEEQQRRMRDSILAEIQDEVKKKAKTAGFSLVIDTAAETVNRTPFVVYNGGENDITDEILTILNATAPAALPQAGGTSPGIATPDAAEKARKDRDKK